MRKDPIKVALQKVQALRSRGLSEDGLAALTELIETGPGVVVSSAAKLVAQWRAADLAPKLRDAFYRLSEDGQEADPQCLGKLAIITALYDLAWQDAGVYVQGCKSAQLEPVYGGSEDSAAPVRTASFHALVQLPAAATGTVMTLLADLLADPSPKVRTQAARSSIYAPAELSYPLLRLKIRTGDAEPRVLGTCFDALLVIEPTEESVALILEYTHSGDDVLQAEALASLASSQLVNAVEKAVVLYDTLSDAQLQRVVLTALGGSPTEAALKFLLHKLTTPSEREARLALESLRPKLYDEDMKAQVLKMLRTRQDKTLLDVYKNWT